MRFIDYNGSGGLDSQDISTNIAVEKAEQTDGGDRRVSPRQLSGNAGCAAMAAFIALPILAIVLAL